jgi:serine/threonine-protein kinase
MDASRWERVKQIVADAMDVETAGRPAFVRGATAGDAGLEAEVMRILAAGADRDSLLDTAPAESPGRLVSTRRASGAHDADTPYPAELIERGARRLGTLALLYASGLLLAYLLYEVTVHGFGGAVYEQRPHTPGQLMAAGFIALGLAVWRIATLRRWPPHRIVRLAFTFEVAGAFGIALVSYSGAFQLETPVWGVSWISVWIMMFPLVIPGPPRQAAFAAFGAAATGPAALLIWGATREFTFPTVSVVLATTLPNFMVAVLAWFGSRYIYRIGLELRAARRLGRYRLVERIGVGGMGEVWRAEHDMLARPAALKLVRPELMRRSGVSVEALANFEREAQSTAALSSPHTVNLYDFGLTDEDVFYYAMELLEGLDLDALVRKHGRVAPARAVHFLTQACDSLAEAHAMELVHRDVKPSNLFACRQGLTHDFIKVLDFGIVRPLARQGDQPQAIAPLEGTPGWIAPEVAVSGVADPRADLYALGCVGYWLLTGAQVFDGQDLDTLIRRHRETPALAPSLRAPAVPAALDAVILACLAKDPAQRPASAPELARRLRQAGAGVWTQADAAAWWEAHAPRPAGDPRARLESRPSSR